jgi:hypothetical protein
MLRGIWASLRGEPEKKYLSFKTVVASLESPCHLILAKSGLLVRAPAALRLFLQMGKEISPLKTATRNGVAGRADRGMGIETLPSHMGWVQ